MLQYPERDLFLRGLRALVGFKQTGVDYVRPERMFGRTTNSLFKNLGWAKKGILSFSNTPLSMLSFVATLLFLASIALGGAQLVLRLLFPAAAPKGRDHGAADDAVLRIDQPAGHRHRRRVRREDPRGDASGGRTSSDARSSAAARCARAAPRGEATMQCPTARPTRTNLVTSREEHWKPPTYAGARRARSRRCARGCCDSSTCRAARSGRTSRSELPSVTGTVVDVGCGLQPFRRLFGDGVKYIGIDYADTREHFAVQAPDTIYYSGDRWPLESETADFILCTETLEHVLDSRRLPGRSCFAA